MIRSGGTWHRGGSGCAMVILVLASGLPAVASEPARVSKSDAWQSVDLAAVRGIAAEPGIQPDRFHLYTLDQSEWLDTLKAAPPEQLDRPRDIRTDGLEIMLPTPDGVFARFRTWESPILAPELAAKFPEIRTYIAQGVDDPAATARLDWTVHGFHAQVLSPAGAYYIDPYIAEDTAIYAVYHRRDYPRPPGFSCQLEPGAPRLQAGGVAAVTLPSGDQLRTYRLAVAATGEYTQFHGGTVAAGLSAIVTAVNRVNGIYEVEVAVRMELVANNNLIIYTNAATDPYSNFDGGAMLNQNQNNLNVVIGSANYDIGHVFSTGGGGVAGLGVVCYAPLKAWGVTGLPAPIGDPFYVDYVAHEMGHQFGALHTFNGIAGSCGGNRSASAAYEPGSGSTIMAYAGICGADNLQSHSDPYFHSKSFDEIREYITIFDGNDCPVITATGNAAPNVSAGADFAIPANTPFILTASGSDPDGDDVTFAWEERDLGPAQSLAAGDNGSSPLFRTFNPSEEPARFFPELSDYVNDTEDPAEDLPGTNRTMQFRVTARDHRAGGGGVNWDAMSVTVLTDAPPFVVTFPTSIINANGPQLVEWEVGDTASPPIGSTTVDILLSTDNGETFPTTLLASTPNDGSETVMIPDVPTANARIMVRSVDGIFYAVSGLCPDTLPIQLSAPRRNRYLSITSLNSGRPTAIRVRFGLMPNDYNAFEGAVYWVGPPVEVCENAGQATPGMGGCPAVPGLANPSFLAAPLVCEPYYTNWGALGPIQVYHHAIIPDVVYTVDTLDVLCDAELSLSYSSFTTVPMPYWGDVVNNCSTNPCSAPNDVIDIADVVSILDKFRNTAGAPVKSRADLEPGVLDFRVNISDVTAALAAFSGTLYPFPPAGPPCP